jgi:WD40 repeat protein
MKNLTFLIITFLSISNFCFSQIIRTIKETDDIDGFSSSYDGKILVTGIGNLIKSYNAQTGELLTQFKVDGNVTAINLDPNGIYLAVASSNWSTYYLKYYNMAIARGVNLNNTHKDKIICLAINPAGTILATGSKDNTIKLFDLKSFKELVTLKGHKGHVRSLAFSSDGKFLLSGSEDNKVKLWDLDKNIDLITYDGATDYITSVCFSPDNTLVAAGSDDKYVRVWKIDDGKAPIMNFWGHKGKVNSVAFSPDGKFLASGSSDNTFKLWSIEKQSFIPIRLGMGVNHTKSIKNIAFTRDGRLYTVSEDKTIKYWNWGFPILNMTDIKLVDTNDNGSIEGTEPVKISFTVDNDGYGDALKVRLSISELSKVKGLTVPDVFDIGDLAAKSSKTFAIPITSTKELVDSTAKFRFFDLATISYQPITPQEQLLTVKTVAIPILNIKDQVFADADSNKILDGREEGKILFKVENNGAGLAENVVAHIAIKKPIQGLEFDDEINVGNIKPMSMKMVSIPIRSTKKLQDGIADFDIHLTEKKELLEEKMNITFKTRKYNPTVKEEIKEYVENNINEWQRKGKYEKTDDFRKRVNEDSRQKQIDLLTQQAIDTLALRNLVWKAATNEYDADNESFKISIPNFVPFYIKVPLAHAGLFDDKFKKFVFYNPKYTVSDNNFALLHIELRDTTDTTKFYVYDSKDMIAFNSTQLDFDFDPVSIDIQSDNLLGQRNDNKVLKVGKSDVDQNIPENPNKNPNIYALIIGNEDYSSYQTGLNNEVNVDFAINDAKIFKEYVVKTLGVPDENVTLKTNATLGQMKQSIAKLSKLTELSDGKAAIIFYYSGHGLPDEVSKEAYIMPVDISGMEIQSAIKLNDLYAQLNQFPSKKVTVILDACFTGGARNQSLIAMKGVKIRPKDQILGPNMIVLTSSSGEESSAVYREKQHGLFTYYLLQKLQAEKGNVDYKSLVDYVSDKVKLQSVLINNKTQTPQVLISSELQNSWDTLKFASN